MEVNYPIMDPDAAGIPQEDQICACGHWYDEHKPGLWCAGCEAYCKFEYGPEQNTPEAIADRGGEPRLWPQHVKDYFARTAGKATNA